MAECLEPEILKIATDKGFHGCSMHELLDWMSSQKLYVIPIPKEFEGKIWWEGHIFIEGVRLGDYCILSDLNRSTVLHETVKEAVSQYL
jgi:hypothetical protein